MNLNNTFDSINCLNGINVFTSVFTNSKRPLFVYINCILCRLRGVIQTFSSDKDDRKVMTSASEKSSMAVKHI